MLWKTFFESWYQLDIGRGLSNKFEIHSQISFLEPFSTCAWVIEITLNILVYISSSQLQLHSIFLYQLQMVSLIKYDYKCYMFLNTDKYISIFFLQMNKEKQLLLSLYQPLK